MRRGFTLIELLLVIGIIAILAGIVIVAVNPSKQIAKARDAARVKDAKEIQNALAQHYIQVGSLSNDSKIPTGQGSSKHICKQGVTEIVEPTCVNLDVLVTQNILAALPRDPNEGCDNYSGFKVYKGGPQMFVEPAHLGSASVSTLGCGLVGYWRLDEAGGLTVGDGSGNGNNGTIGGSPLSTADVPPVTFPDPQSLTFNGADTSVDIPDSSVFDISSFTLAAWIKTADAGTLRRRIVNQQGGTFWILALSNNVLELGSSIDGVLTVNGPALNNNQWRHVAVSRAAGTGLYWYVDGVLIASQAISNSSTYAMDTNPQIGRYYGGSEYFNGKIDDVRVYNRALTTAEVSSLAAGNN